MVRTAVVCSLAALAAGCASSSVRERPSDARPGLGPDLRVFADDKCIPNTPVVRATPPGGLASQLVSGVASLAVKSFGRFLEEAGSPEIETASGIRADFFYDSVVSPQVLNPSLRCLYIVRDGFESKSFDASTPPDLKATWQRLGLTGTPSLYAMVQLDPASDDTAVFKATMLDFTVQRYARVGAEATRDVVVFLEFNAPSGGRQYKVTPQGDIQFDPVGPFARGGMALRGVTKGPYMRKADLQGVESGWMTNPAPKANAGRYATNLYVDVVELKHGNPFIADLGRFLQSAPIADAAGAEAARAVDTTKREQDKIAASVDASKAERTLAHALESKNLALRTALASTDTAAADLLAAAQAAEDAASDVQLQKRQKGWTQDDWKNIEPMLSDAATLSVQARARIADKK